jgi:hypothetical protein
MRWGGLRANIIRPYDGGDVASQRMEPPQTRMGVISWHPNAWNRHKSAWVSFHGTPPQGTATNPHGCHFMASRRKAPPQTRRGVISWHPEGVISWHPEGVISWHPDARNRHKSVGVSFHGIPTQGTATNAHGCHFMASQRMEPPQIRMGVISWHPAARHRHKSAWVSFHGIPTQGTATNP